MFVASVISSACNYLYQIYVGRSLGPEGYGTFGSLFAIFYLTYIFSGTFQAGSAQFVSRYKAYQETDKIGAFICGLVKRTIVLGVIGFSTIILFSSRIRVFLNIDSEIQIFVLGTVIFVSFLLPGISGVIQGLQDFSSLALVSLLTFIPKLLFGVILVSMGYGIAGALGAVTLGLTTAFIFAVISLKPHLTKRVENVKDRKSVV